VFESDALDAVVQGARQRVRAGGPAWHRCKLKVLPCPAMGVVGGWDVDMMFVFNSPVASWEAQLPAKTRNWLSHERSSKASARAMADCQDS
jgi:hypothetical protein